MKVGEKIRYLRRQMHMTQADLAGEQMTRNMVCQIERGSALPSLPSLLYIASRLQVAPGYLLSEEGNFIAYQKEAYMEGLKRLFAERRFEEVVRYAAAYFQGQEDDEISLVLLHAHIELGLHEVLCGNIAAAAEHVITAQALCDTTVYPIEDARARLTLLRAVTANVLLPRIELNEESYLIHVEKSAWTDLFHYLMEDRQYTYYKKEYADHMRAKQLIADKRYEEALRILQELEGRKANTEEIGAFLLLRIYADMEICYKECRDFERAYRYASKRLNIINALHT